MSNLLASLRSSANALDAVVQATGVTQNNIANAGTAGYAKQRVSLQARPFDPDNGLAGGVQFGPLQSARDQYVERSVRTQNAKTTHSETRSTTLTRLEQVLRLSSGDSVPAALNKFYAAVSAWAVAPDDPATRDNVLTAGGGVAMAFHGITQELDTIVAENGTELQSVVDRVNRLAEQIREYNVAIRRGFAGDAGVDAGIHATLDELSADIDVQAVRQDDGTFTLLLDGQHPLVMGEDQYDLKLSFEIPAGVPRPGSTPRATIRVGSGPEDRTSVIDGGRLGALLSFRHGALAEVNGDVTQKGEVERLAEKIVERLNHSWPPPGPAFMVAGASPMSIARTLQMNPALSAAMLDALDPGPPPVANGKALQMAKLANPGSDEDKLDGLSFSSFFGKIASNVGTQLNDANFDRQSQTHLMAQAQAFRDQISSVSLDEEALYMLEFQRAYEASARIVTVLDEMLQTAVNIGRG
ncbi:MAG TPA: flagellar hook-associated protein FlgK [Bryobacteraceae bacterium]|nr:flagellar hook-associated protein FlgK [Bryobacteraceae bacterium]